MYVLRVTVELIDDKTGAPALARHGGDPVIHRTRFFPLFEKSSDGEGPAFSLYQAIGNVMGVASDFYRVGGIQKDL